MQNDNDTPPKPTLDEQPREPLIVEVPTVLTRIDAQIREYERLMPQRRPPTGVELERFRRQQRQIYGRRRRP